MLLKAKNNVLRDASRPVIPEAREQEKHEMLTFSVYCLNGRKLASGLTREQLEDRIVRRKGRCLVACDQMTNRQMDWRNEYSLLHVDQDRRGGGR